MNEAHRTTLATAAGVTAFAVVYLCAAFLEWPLLTYFPERGAWRFVAHAPPTAIPFYGLVFWGALAAIDAGVVAWFLAGAVARRPPSRTLSALCAGWTLAALVLATGYFALRALP